MDRGDRPTGRVTNYVALGTLNWMHGRKHHAKAVETYERLHQSAGFELLHAAQKDFLSAVDLFQTYEGLSFGDATIAAHMQREGIEYLSPSTTTSACSMAPRGWKRPITRSIDCCPQKQGSAETPVRPFGSEQVRPDPAIDAPHGFEISQFVERRPDRRGGQ